MQEWIKASGAKVCVVFEGRDTAGKGGTIKAITERVSPRVFQVVALPAPTDRERSQMYIQRYIPHLPAAGEVVDLRPQLVQPGGRRAGDALLHPGGGGALPAAGAGRRAGHGRLGDLAAQVLARGQRRRADPAPGEPDQRPPEDLEALGHGPQVLQPLVRLLPGPRRDVRRHRHRLGARGTWRAPTTRSAAGSTSSATSSARSPTSPSPPGTSSCPNGSEPTATWNRTCPCGTSRPLLTHAAMLITGPGGPGCRPCVGDDL